MDGIRMSKSRRGDETPKIQAEATVPPSPPATDVPPHKRCPSCYGGRGGIGQDNGRYAPKNLFYFKCDQCGHTWSAEIIVKTEVVRVDHRLPDPLSTR